MRAVPEKEVAAVQEVCVCASVQVVPVISVSGFLSVHTVLGIEFKALCVIGGCSALACIPPALYEGG